MNETRLCTIAQIEQFFSATASIEFSATGDDSERYGHISRVLTRFDYPGRRKRERGVLHRYLQHTSGYSRAQVTRLVTRWHRNRLASVPLAKRYSTPAAPSARKYSAIDVEWLLEMDKAHEDICGPAIAHLLQRAYSENHRVLAGCFRERQGATVCVACRGSALRGSPHEGPGLCRGCLTCGRSAMFSTGDLDPGQQKTLIAMVHFSARSKANGVQAPDAKLQTLT